MTIRQTFQTAISTSNLSVREKFQLRLAMLLPGPRSKIEEALTQALQEEGLVPAEAAFDTASDAPGMQALNWDAIAKFIQTMLPIILQIIALFPK